MAAATLVTRQCQSETNASVRRMNRENMVRHLEKAEDTDAVDLGSRITLAKNLQCNRSAFV